MVRPTVVNQFLPPWQGIKNQIPHRGKNHNPHCGKNTPHPPKPLYPLNPHRGNHPTPTVAKKTPPLWQIK